MTILKPKEEHMASIVQVEGIGEAYAERLKAAGIRTTDALLEAGATAKGRKEIEEKTHIAHSLILEWVNHVDLWRLKGVAEEYSDLLEEAGVDSIPELAQRRADNLFEKLVAVNQEKQLVRRLPTQAQVANWIEQAKALPRIVTH
jgi:predicted flap endonuclease-1-like 5' DNA nuclease